VEAFGARLNSVLAGNGRNVAFSPASLHVALSVLHAGARGDTAAELSRLLGGGPESSGSPGSSVFTTMRNARGLTAANRLDLERSVTFRSEYVTHIQEHFHAEVAKQDFAKKPLVARAEINSWVRQQTQQMVPEILPPFGIGPRTRLVVTNAITFHATWSDAFSPKLTQYESFHLADGSEVRIPMMHQAKGSVHTAETRSGTWVALRYSASDVNLYAATPRHGATMEQLEAELAQTGIAELSARLKPRFARLVLPKFSLDSGTLDMNAALRSLGASVMFERPDFSGITAEPIGVERILHRCVIRVDEEGTTASAASAVSAGVPISGESVEELRLDRPFAFVIADGPSGLVLFRGRVMDPRVAGDV
jgi:serpin B